MKIRMFRAGALALAIALLSACGGGGGGGSTGGTSAPTSLGGFVIDGYIEGATVCLDLNTNQSCDAGEPSATTGANGRYTLNLQGLTTAQVRAAHLLTLVPTTAKDADDGGQTLAQAGKAAFNLLAPASAYLAADGNSVGSAVISPLTTLVSHTMIAGNGTALDDAEAAVRLRLGLVSGTNLREDFVAANNTALHTQAQVIASVIGQVRASAKLVGGTTDPEALMAALSYLQQNITALQMAMANDTSGGTWSAKLATALAQAHLAPVVAELLGDAKKVTASTPTDIATVFAEGFYHGSCWTIDYCTLPAYSKGTGHNGQWTSSLYEWDNSAWASIAPYDSSHRLTNTGWVATKQHAQSTGSYTLDGQGGGTVSDSFGQLDRFSARTVDVSGLASTNIAGLNWGPSMPSFTFAAGSKLYWIQSEPLTDSYWLQAKYQLYTFPCNSGCAPIFLTSIDELIAAYPTANAGASANRYLTEGADHLVTFDAGGTPTGGTVSVWSDGVTVCTKDEINSHCVVKSGTPVYTKIGTAPYEIKVVHGQTILVIKAISKIAPYIHPIYSASNGQLHRGTMNAVGLTPSTVAGFNQAGINSVLSAVGKGQVLN